MRGIKVGVLYELKDKLTGGGLNKIKRGMRDVNKLKDKAKLKMKEYGQSFRNSLKGALPSLQNFKMKNAQMFEAISSRVPFLGQLGGLLSNPYVLAAAAVAALATAVVKLFRHMVQLTKEIKANQKVIRATFGLTGDELTNITAKGMAMSDVLQVEFKDLSKAANSLQREYADTGITVADSLNMIRTGIQATGGEFDLEEIREYASQMRKVGLSAQEFIALSAISKKEGIFNDKAVDAIKEANLSLREMTKIQQDALKGIGIDPKAISKAFDEGTMSTMDAIRMISRKMAKANTVARQTAIADIFKGAGEDAGEKFLLSLGQIDLSMKGITKGMEDMIHHQNTQISLNEDIRKQQSRMAEVMSPIIKKWDILKLRAQRFFYRILGDAMEWFQRQWIKMEPIVMDIWKILKRNLKPVLVVLIGLVKILAGAFSIVFSIIRGIYNGIKQFFTAIGDGIQWVYSALGGEGNIWDIIFGTLDKWQHKIKVFFQDLYTLGSKTFKLLEAGLEGDLERAGKLIKELRGFRFRDASKVMKSSGLGTMAVDPAGNLITPRANPEGDNSSATSIAERSVQQRNVTVNIGSLNSGGITLHTKNIQESSREIEDAFVEMLMRAVRNVEQTI